MCGRGCCSKGGVVGDGYTIDPRLRGAMRGAVEWLLTEARVDPARVDGGPVGKVDRTIDLGETVHFLYNAPEWRRYLPAFDKLRLKHPLDPRLPAPITHRAIQLTEQINQEIPFAWGAPGYCEAFVPRFFAAGLAAFADGGLGWAVPLRVQLEHYELTAPEAYAGVLDARRPFGSCSEATAKVLTAFAAVGSPCSVAAVGTQNHVFARAAGMNLDPSALGKIGWERPQTERDMATAYYTDLAIELLSHGRGVAAIEHLTLARLINPEDPQVRSLLGTALLDPVAGVQALVAAVSGNPDDVSYYRALAQRLQQIPDRQTLPDRVAALVVSLHAHPYAVRMAADVCFGVEQCPALAARIDATFPGRGHGDAILGLEAYWRGEEQEAAHYVQAALRADPNHAVGLWMHGALALHEGRLADAATAAQRSSLLAPNLENNHAVLAAIHLAQGNFDAARDEAQREFLVFGSNPNGKLSLIDIFSETGDLAMAEGLAWQHIREQPNDPNGPWALANVLLTAGREREAVRAAMVMKRMLRSLTDRPEFNEARLGAESILFAVAMARQDLRQARVSLETMRALDPVGRTVMPAEIVVLQAEHQYDTALTLCERLRAAAPELVDGPALHAQTLLLLGREREAREAMNVALRLNPRSQAARDVELQLAFDVGALGRFRTVWEAYLKDFGRVPDVQLLAAYYAYAQGDAPRARVAVAAVPKAYAEEQNVLLVRALLAVDGGRLREAQSLARRLNARHPLSDTGPLVEARVAIARGNLSRAERAAREAVRRYPYDNGKIPAFSGRRLLIDILTRQGRIAEAATAQREMDVIGGLR